MSNNIFNWITAIIIFVFVFGISISGECRPIAKSIEISKKSKKSKGKKPKKTVSKKSAKKQKSKKSKKTKPDVSKKQTSALTKLPIKYYSIKDLPTEAYKGKKTEFDIEYYNRPERPNGVTFGAEIGFLKYLENDCQHSLGIVGGGNVFFVMGDFTMFSFRVGFPLADTGIGKVNEEQFKLKPPGYITFNLTQYFFHYIYLRGGVGMYWAKMESLPDVTVTSGLVESEESNTLLGFIATIGIGTELRISRFVALNVGFDYYLASSGYYGDNKSLEKMSYGGIVIGLTLY